MHTQDFIGAAIPSFGSGEVVTEFGVRVSFSTRFATPELIADAVDELVELLKRSLCAPSNPEERQALLHGTVQLIGLASDLRRAWKKWGVKNLSSESVKLLRALGRRSPEIARAAEVLSEMVSVEMERFVY